MEVTFRDITIASGSTSSLEIDLTGGNTLVGVITPSAVSGTTIGVSVAVTSGGTFVPIKDGSGDMALTMAASKYVYIDPKYTMGVRYAKLMSSTSETSARTLTVATRQMR